MDADLNRYLRVTATYEDGHGTGKVLSRIPTTPVSPEPTTLNNPPEFPAGPLMRSIPENARPNGTVGARVIATDSDGHSLTYGLDGGLGNFTIVDVGNTAGQIRVAPGATLDHETGPTLTVTVTATDPTTMTDTVVVTIEVTDVNEPPEAESAEASTREDEPVTIDVLNDVEDPEDEQSALTVNIVRRPENGSVVVNAPANRTITYTPGADYNGSDSFTYQAQDTGRLRSNEATVSLTISEVNDAPTFFPTTAARSVPEDAERGDDVGPPVTATDVDAGDMLTYSLSGPDELSFVIDPDSGQITVADMVTFDIVMTPTYMVTVTATDSADPPGTATVAVTITVVTGPVAPPPSSGGGGFAEVVAAVAAGAAAPARA